MTIKHFPRRVARLEERWPAERKEWSNLELARRIAFILHNANRDFEAGRPVSPEAQRIAKILHRGQEDQSEIKQDP